LASLGSAAQVPKDDLPADPAIRAVVVAQEESLAKLPAGTCAFHAAYDEVKRDRKTTSDGTLKVKGTSRYADWSAVSAARGAHVRPPPQRQRAFLNEVHFAFWVEGTPIAYQYATGKRDAITHRVNNLIVLHFPRDPVLAAYGNGTQDLRSILSLHSKVNHYSVEESAEAGGRKVFRIHVNMPADPNAKPARWIYEVDASRGYAVTHMVFNENGKPALERWVNLQAAGSAGAWFPKHVKECWSHVLANKTTELESTYEANYEDYKVVDARDGDFDLNALGLPPRVVVLSSDPAGAVTHLVPKDGQWVPVDLLRRANGGHTREVLSSDRRRAVVTVIGLCMPLVPFAL
jgi:hypothetical protein